MNEEKKVDIQLTIGGEDIPMLPFIQKILYNVVYGVVSTLKGFEEGKEIVVKIK